MTKQNKSTSVECELCHDLANPNNFWHPAWCEKCEYEWFDEWMKQQKRVTNKSAL